MKRLAEIRPVPVAAALDLGEAGDQRGLPLRDEAVDRRRCASIPSPLAPSWATTAICGLMGGGATLGQKALALVFPAVLTLALAPATLWLYARR
jgi:hypothetical protein